MNPNLNKPNVLNSRYKEFLSRAAKRKVDLRTFETVAPSGCQSFIQVVVVWLYFVFGCLHSLLGHDNHQPPCQVRGSSSPTEAVIF